MPALAKRLVLVLVLACMVLPGLVGCGVATTVQDNNRTISRVWAYDAHMMTDDLGELVLCERPWRGSRYPVK